MNQVSKLVEEINGVISSKGFDFAKAYNKLVEVKSLIKTTEQKLAFNRVIKDLLQEEKKENLLFPNEVPDYSFAMPSSFSDTYNSILSKVDLDEFSLESSLIKVGEGSRSVSLNLDKKKDIGLLFDNKEILNLGTSSLEKSISYIKSVLQDGTVLQHYCALWNYAVNYEKSFKFYCVKIDSILATFLKKPSDGYFRQSTRQAFTKSIRTLQGIKIRISLTGKGTEYINIPLLDFSLSTENKDRSVILRLIGSIFGGNQFNKRGRLFPQGIFKLDARKEGPRISLAFKLATRFDQVNHSCLKWTRKKLIQCSGLSKTDAVNKTQASLYLLKALKRLKETGCIGDFQGKVTSTDDAEEIQIYACEAHSKLNLSV